jgi:hypothetical protein
MAEKKKKHMEHPWDTSNLTKATKEENKKLGKVGGVTGALIDAGQWLDDKWHKKKKKGYWD